MYLQEILEVGIGLVFMWLVLSIAAMQLQEWIANLLQWRAKDLQSAIRKMLASKDLAETFYRHQLIRGLSKDLSWSDQVRQKVGNFFRRRFGKPPRIAEHLPSYIPANEFALTVFDLIMQAGTEASPVRQAFDNFHTALDSLSTDKIDFKSKEELKEAFRFLMEEARELATSEVGEAAVETLKEKIRAAASSRQEIKDEVELLIDNLDAYYQRLLEENRNMPEKKDRSILRLRYGLVALGMNNPKLQESLRPLLIGVEEMASDTEHAILIARKNIETWFNNAMDRLSGWYKRKTQLVAFLIGLFLALAFNVDSIYVATSLWREPTLRQALVQNANAFIEQNASLPDGETQNGAQIVRGLQEQLQALAIPFGWETETYLLKAGEKCQLIPLGQGAVWGLRSGDACKKISNAPADSTGWLSKVTGMLLSALATTQGAPFWFDILKKLVNVRSSGPNPSEQKPAD